MRLLYDNKIKGAILTPSSENANYPASNLKDPRLSRHLRFTGDATENLLIDSGGLLKDIFQATVNLLENSNDLTLWDTYKVTVIASGLFYDGSEFVKVTNSDAATGYIYQLETPAFTSLIISENVICRKGSTVGNTAVCRIYNSTTFAWIFRLVVDFDNYPNSPGTPTVGTLRWYRWIDSETVELHYTCVALDLLTDNVDVRFYASPNPTVGEYTYWMRPQLEDLPYDTPYVDGSRAAVSPNYPFEMLEKFIFKVKVRPWFVYDTSIHHRFLSWYIDATHVLRLIYSAGVNKIAVGWQDGGVVRAIFSQQFGGAFDNINSDLIIFGAIRLDQQTGQRFFVIIDEVKQTEDTSFDGVPDPKITTFPTLSVGHENSTAHANSQFESVQLWAWDGSDLGTLDSEADIDAAMKDSPPIFEQIYQPKIKASYAALAGHNLSAGAEILILGNDWNSWIGSPFEQMLVWNADIILKNFTEKEYPYWRFVFKDPNNADGYVKLGLAYLGTYYQVDKSFQKDFTEQKQNTDRLVLSKSGQAYGQKGIIRRRYALHFPYWNNTAKKAVEAIVDAVGKRNPHFMIGDENNPDKLPPLYCVIEGDVAYTHIHNYIYKGSITFLEVF